MVLFQEFLLLGQRNSQLFREDVPPVSQCFDFFGLEINLLLGIAAAELVFEVLVLQANINFLVLKACDVVLQSLFHVFTAHGSQKVLHFRGLQTAKTLFQHSMLVLLDTFEDLYLVLLLHQLLQCRNKSQRFECNSLALADASAAKAGGRNAAL